MGLLNTVVERKTLLAFEWDIFFPMWTDVISSPPSLEDKAQSADNYSGAFLGGTEKSK